MSFLNAPTFHSISSICEEGINSTKFKNEKSKSSSESCDDPELNLIEIDRKNFDIFRQPLNYFIQSSKKPAFSISNKHYEEPTTTTTLPEDSPQSSPSNQDSDEHKIGNNIECVVCGDKSSGKHYGQYTCEGCKSFFKRSVRRNLTYSCRGNHNCPIDIHHRNQCQNCRFQKCINMGMRKEAVQQGRIPQFSSQYGQYIASSYGSSYFNRFLGVMMHDNSILSKQDKIGFMNKFFLNQNSVLEQNNADKFIGMDGICDLANTILQSVIQWSKSIPFFPELSISDQITLLSACWGELFILTSAHSSIPLHLAPLLASVGLQANPCGAEKVVILLDHIRTIQDQIDKLKKIQIDAAEFSCLKALVLFNSDTRGLSDTIHVEQIQETVQNALEEYERFHYPIQTTRFGKLLLRIPQLKSINSAIIEELLFKRLSGRNSVKHQIEDCMINGYSYNCNNKLPEDYSAKFSTSPCPIFSLSSNNSFSLWPTSPWLPKSFGKLNSMTANSKVFNNSTS